MATLAGLAVSYRKTTRFTAAHADCRRGLAAIRSKAQGLPKLRRSMGAVKKFKPTSMLYSRLLSDKAGAVRRSAAKVVKDARGAVRTSENLVARSHEVVQRAERDMKELKAKKAQRASRKADLEKHTIKEH
jgi:hypothetical protein